MGTLPYHVSLRYYMLDSKNFRDLTNFLDDHSHLQGLTITARLLIPKMTDEIRRLTYLNELVLNIDTNTIIPKLPLHCLETIFILNANNFDITDSDNILDISNLKNIYHQGPELKTNIIQTLIKKTLGELSLLDTEVLEINDCSKIVKR